jgi:hypothetical protein
VHTSSITRGANAVAVGLFGEQRKVIVGRSRLGDPARRGAESDQPVHGVRRLEPEGSSPGPAEGLADLLQHLVRAVGGPNLLGSQREAGCWGEVRGQVRAQRRRLPVGIAVERRRGLDHGRTERSDQLG